MLRNIPKEVTLSEGSKLQEEEWSGDRQSQGRVVSETHGRQGYKKGSYSLGMYWFCEHIWY